MVAKFLFFYLAYMLTGNPILAIILVFVIYYVIDRRYIGLFPSIVKPFRQFIRISNLEKQLTMNPHDMPARYELAQAYMERRRYTKALELLEGLPPSMKESAEVVYDTGACKLALGQLETGEGQILEAISMNGDLRYGEPYLKLATALAPVNPKKALEYLQEFQFKNFSSCESYYRLALLQTQFGDKTKAKQALKQCIEIYRSLPRFRKKVERRWAVRARLKLIFS